MTDISLPRHRVSALILRNRKILLIHRIKEGHEYWSFPGGGIEEGEDPQDAIVREVLEETSLPVLQADLAFTVVEEHRTGKRRNHYFGVQVANGTPQIGGPELERSTATNIYTLHWINKMQIPKLNLAVSPQAEAKLNKYLEL